ncbi:RWD domain-containing protein [Diplonema papillatum]|nr:RWD domain-containing protein [Diplonema papillatum]
MNEEVEMEIMALESIYGEEMKVVDDGKKVRVEIYDTSHGDPASAKRVELIVTFPPTYPEDVPNINLRSVRGLTRAQVDPLHAMLKHRCEELISQPMVFELGNFIQEWMTNGMVNPYAQEAQNLDNVVIETKRKHGTPVTRENFEEWKEQYLRDKEKLNPKRFAEVKLTGRQIFDKTMNSVDWGLFADDEFDESELPYDDEEDEEEED